MRLKALKGRWDRLLASFISTTNKSMSEDQLVQLSFYFELLKFKKHIRNFVPLWVRKKNTMCLLFFTLYRTHGRIFIKIYYTSSKRKFPAKHISPSMFGIAGLVDFMIFAVSTSISFICFLKVIVTVCCPSTEICCLISGTKLKLFCIDHLFWVVEKMLPFPRVHLFQQTSL